MAKHNCYLVCATPTSNSTTPVASLIEPFQLQNYGNEYAEIQELKSRLGWSSAAEVAKFYDHKGTDTWYHYVYGQPNGKKEGKSKNDAVSRAGYQGNDISSWLAKSLDFYKTDDARDVFAKRERSRFQRKMGM